MNTTTLRARPSARARRAIRRRAIWLLLLAVMIALMAWRYGVPRRIVVSPAAIMAPTLPPLANKLVQVHYHNVVLSQVLADLSRQAGVQFNVDWKSLRDAGLEANMAIDCDSESDQAIPLTAAFVLLIAPDRTNLDADFTTDPLFISTSRGISNSARLLTVMYPIGDLIQVRDPWSTKYTRQERIDDLIKMTEDLVAIDQWKDNGGSVGSIREVDGILIATATPTMHYQIRDLFDALRRLRGD